MSIYDFKLPQDFDSEMFEALEDSTPVSDDINRQARGGRLDPDSVAFRRVTADESFMWCRPGYEFGEENSKVKVEEVVIKDDVYAVRGIIVKPMFGLQLQADPKAQQERNFRPICYVDTAIHADEYGNAEILNSERPLRTPIFQPHESKSNPTRMMTPTRDLMHSPYLKGSRGEFCAQCVSNGNHFIGSWSKNENGQDEFDGQVCRHTGELLFCVFEVGIMTEVGRRIDKQTVKERSIKWVPVTEWKRRIIEEDGEHVDVNRYEKPFIIRMSAPQSHVFTKIDSEEFRIDYSKSNYLDSTKTTYNLRDYLKYLSSPSVRATVLTKGNFWMYPMLTDIYLVKATPTSKSNLANAKGVPVYAPADATRSDSENAARIARLIYMDERELCVPGKKEPVYEVMQAFQKPNLTASEPKTVVATVVPASLPEPNKVTKSATSTLPPAELNYLKSADVTSQLDDLLG